jgi:hypothetical protein
MKLEDTVRDMQQLRLHARKKQFSKRQVGEKKKKTELEKWYLILAICYMQSECLSSLTDLCITRPLPSTVEHPSYPCLQGHH